MVRGITITWFWEFCYGIKTVGMLEGSFSKDDVK